MKNNFVFVYGTLRKGFWNHKLLENSKFVGFGKTKEKYSLYADGIPYVVKEPLTQVKGEIYQVDSETLKKLDKLEGHPHFYKRELTDILMEDGKIIKAWIYFYPYKKGDLIKSGNYKDYRR